MTSFMDSIYAGKDRFVQDQERKRQETTRKLFGDALQNKPDALTQLYGVDPATALKVKESNQGDRVKGAQFMHRAATVLKSTPDDQKSIVYTRLMQEAKANPYVAEFTQGLPDQYDPSIMQHVDGLIGMAGMYEDQPKPGDTPALLQSFDGMASRMGLKPGSPEYQQAARVWANLDPKAKAQIVEGEGGYNVATFGGGNNPTAAPIMTGGAPAPVTSNPVIGSPAPLPAPQQGGMKLTDLDPMISAFGGKISSTFRTPAHNAAVGGKPNSQHLTSNAMDVVFPNANAKRMAIEAAKKNGYMAIEEGDHVHFQVDRRGGGGGSGGTQLRPPPKEAPKTDVPSGYRLKADGATLEPIPGGPADPATKATTTAAKPLPVAAVTLIENAQDSLAAAEGINQMLADYSGRINRGELKVGLLQNLISKTRNATNNSDANSKNFASLQATLEKMRNQSLTLNKGVQTDGDAQRAWNELMANLNDEGVVKQRLAEIQALNVRAAKLQREKIARIQRNYGGGGSEAPAAVAPAQASTPAPAKPAGQALSIEERIARGKYKVD